MKTTRRDFLKEDEKIEQIARVTHEANRAWCEAKEDFSQLSWDEAPEWQKDGARNGVRFHLENPGTTPERSHEEWREQKAREGWTYGEVKCPDRKIHPCMVSYNELPVLQQKKDAVFAAIVEALK